MNKSFIEEQKKVALQKLESFGNEEGQEKRKVSIVFQYLSSLLAPDAFTDAEKEDLRKLALEFDYKEDSNFEKWCKSFSLQR